jgi:thymidylate synthase (FAD)
MNKSIDLYSDGIGKVELVQSMGTDLTLVNSARVSFGVHKEEMDDKDIKLIKYLLKHKHTSVMEHNLATFRFKVPLFIRSQHHRHRTWSYNEISRRYTAESLEFYEPDAFRTQHKSNRQASNTEDLINPLVSIFTETLEEGDAGVYLASALVKKHHKDSVHLYNALMDSGVCREQARGVLPQNLYTEYYGTANLNNLLKFIDARTHEGAQWEIQQVAKAVKDIITDLWPITMQAYKEISS